MKSGIVLEMVNCGLVNGEGKYGKYFFRFINFGKSSFIVKK